jgi:hypothetical protein
LYTKNYFAPENTSYEYESYVVPFTQSDSNANPSSTTMGDCSDPSTFKVAIIDSGYMVKHPDIAFVSPTPTAKQTVLDSVSSQIHGTLLSN